MPIINPDDPNIEDDWPSAYDIHYDAMAASRDWVTAMIDTEQLKNVGIIIETWALLYYGVKTELEKTYK